MRRAMLLVPLLLLAACTGAPEPPAGDAAAPALEQPVPDQPEEDIPPATAPSPGPARFDGYAAMRFGMTEDEARAAVDGALQGATGGPSEACHYVNPGWDDAPQYTAFMFEGGRFVRYDVGNDRDVAPGGGRRGMTADEIRALYPGRVQAGPHKYTDGQYLRIEDTDGDGVLVFETDADGRVTEWRVGLAPQADYVEGCS